MATTTALLTLIATPALAHPGHGPTSGFLHPFTGVDHLLAMIAVGLWAGLVLKKGCQIWPAVFVGFMLAGFGWAQAGGAFPAVEAVILASVVALGLAVGFGLKLPTTAAAGAIAVFGAAHGYAHGQEVPAGVSGAVFAAGFAGATVILHLVGLGAAFALTRYRGETLGRLAGFGVAAAGVAMAVMG